MRALSYRSSSDNGLSFDLLVDGIPLGELLADGNEGIPYWIVEDDLPGWPSHGGSNDPSYRIVTGCSCGEYGCGHSRCRVIKTSDTVTFQEFTGDVGPNGIDHSFTFLRSDYNYTVADIVAESQQQRLKDSENSRQT